MRKRENWTIKDAFEYFNEIDVRFVWAMDCDTCGNLMYLYDEEYSFAGTLQEFTEWCKEYAVLDMDSEINPLLFMGFSDNNFVHVESAVPDGTECAMCKQAACWVDEDEIAADQARDAAELEK